MDNSLSEKFPKYFRLTYKGRNLLLRPLIPSDKGMMKSYYKKLSEKTKYLRFFAIRNSLSEYQLNYFTNVDGISHFAWGILDETDGINEPVGVGRIIRLKGQSHKAEVAITVTDSYQKKGMGRILFALINLIASEAGITVLRHQVLPDNVFVLGFLKRFGILNQNLEEGMTILETSVLNDEEVFQRYPMMDEFRKIL